MKIASFSSWVQRRESTQLFNHRIPILHQVNNNNMPEEPREITSPVASNVKNPPWGTEPDTPATGMQLLSIEALSVLDPQIQESGHDSIECCC